MATFIRILLVILCTLMHGGGAFAAEIEPLPTEHGTFAVALQGDLVAGDAERFAGAVGDRTGGLVVLASYGGSLDDGIRIGEFIRERRFVTVVITGTECFSACALAWLGGTERVLQAGAALAVHAASERDEAGVSRTSAVGNALIGAYLTRLGYPQSTVVWATTASPDRFIYFDETVAREVGVSFHRLPLAGPVADGVQPASQETPSLPPSDKSRVDDDVDLTAAASAFIDNHFRQGEVAYGNPGYVATQYAARVDYFGQNLTREEVLSRRAAYSARWRQTTIWRTAPPTVRCDPLGSRCTISGPATFVATSPQRNAKSEGTLFYRFEVLVTDDGIRIVMEDSEAGERRTGALDPDRLTAVQAVQSALHRHACSPGPVDGSWGRQSAAALERFARATGTAIHRRPVDAETISLLTRTRAPACLSVKEANRGSSVR